MKSILDSNMKLLKFLIDHSDKKSECEVSKIILEIGNDRILDLKSRMMELEKLRYAETLDNTYIKVYPAGIEAYKKRHHHIYKIIATHIVAYILGIASGIAINVLSDIISKQLIK